MHKSSPYTVAALVSVVIQLLRLPVLYVCESTSVSFCTRRKVYTVKTVWFKSLGATISTLSLFIIGTQHRTHLSCFSAYQGTTEVCYFWIMSLEQIFAWINITDTDVHAWAFTVFSCHWPNESRDGLCKKYLNQCCRALTIPSNNCAHFLSQVMASYLFDSGLLVDGATFICLHLLVGWEMWPCQRNPPRHRCLVKRTRRLADVWGLRDCGVHQQTIVNSTAVFQTTVSLRLGGGVQTATIMVPSEEWSSFQWHFYILSHSLSPAHWDRRCYLLSSVYLKC